MIITGKRVENLRAKLQNVPCREDLVICLSSADNYSEVLVKAGFSVELPLGERVLPAPCFGARSRFNADGEYIVHRDRPMETAYRTVEWHWEEFHGRYDRVERSEFRDVPYQRYPRTYVPAPGVELTIQTTINGSKIITTESIEYVDANHDEIQHRINLFLEMFGICEVRNNDLDDIISCEIRNLNWRILPQGMMPWEALRPRLEPIVRDAPEGNQSFIWHRLETINSYDPAFVAIGHGGFNGYVVFGFPDMHFHVLESVHFGNATYVLGDNWEGISQLTKGEILSENRHLARIVHLSNWSERIAALMR